MCVLPLIESRLKVTSVDNLNTNIGIVNVFGVLLQTDQSSLNKSPLGHNLKIPKNHTWNFPNSVLSLRTENSSHSRMSISPYLSNFQRGRWDDI